MRQKVLRPVFSVVLVLFAAVAILSVGCGQQPAADSKPAAFTITLGGGCGALGPAPDLIGTSPSNWRVTEWINSEPLRLDDLRGKVVLVRWFMDSSCPQCSATAPALREFHELYARAGLAVIGMFHNSEAALDEVRAMVEQDYGYTFPVAIDRQTATRREWTLGGDDCGYSDPYRSVTFLIDRRGVVRHVHHEGRYVKGDFAYEEMRYQIERLLMDKPRFDELIDRATAGRFTEADEAEIESLIKAQEQVALIRAGLPPTALDDVAVAGRTE